MFVNNTLLNWLFKNVAVVMKNEIRALDLISMLLRERNARMQESIKIEIAAINRFRSNLFLEDIPYDLGLYDFEEISYDYPKNIYLTTNEIIIRIDEEFSNMLLRDVTEDHSYKKLLDIWENGKK